MFDSNSWNGLFWFLFIAGIGAGMLLLKLFSWIASHLSVSWT